MAARNTSCPECGCVLEKRVKDRSTPQMRRQFALFKAAFHHWSSAHPIQPKNVDHLRRWLQVQAGRYTVVKHVRVHSVDTDKLVALLTAILRTSDDEKLFIEADADLIVVKRADSIAYDELSHADACKLFDEIANVIEQETGFAAEKLLKEMERAA